MSTFKSFAVVGVGNLGLYIAEELLKLQDEGRISEVLVLTRSAPGSHYNLASKGAQIITVDYTSPYSLVSVLTGVDVLISSVGYEAFSLQEELARIAKKCKVKLFVPSEFGFAIQGKDLKDVPTIFHPKENIRRRLLDLDMPYTIFYNGLFPDFVASDEIFAKGLGIDFIEGSVTLGGSGEVPVSFTTREDVARYVCHVLTTMQGYDLLWRIFRIEGERISFKSLLQEYEKRASRPIEYSFRSKESLLDAVERDPNDLTAIILLEAELGRATVGNPEDLANECWPEWKPTRAIDALMRRTFISR